MALITIGLMNPPYESNNTATAFRIIDAALRKGHDVRAFCYEGATALSFALQKPHANSVKGTSVEEEDHPTPKDWISSLFALAKDKGRKLVWCNCGLCVDERGVEQMVEGAGRGSPVDAWKHMEASDGVLFITTR
jgi:tRNA 2-thiouridine synthesizing protein D